MTKQQKYKTANLQNSENTKQHHLHNSINYKTASTTQQRKLQKQQIIMLY